MSETNPKQEARITADMQLARDMAHELEPILDKYMLQKGLTPAGLILGLTQPLATMFTAIAAHYPHYWPAIFDDWIVTLRSELEQDIRSHRH